jgi:hypothetical protein
MPEIKIFFNVDISKQPTLKIMLIIRFRFFERINLQKAAKKAIEELKLNQGYGKITVCGCCFLVRDIGRTVPSVLCEWIAAMIATFTNHAASEREHQKQITTFRECLVWAWEQQRKW